MLAHELTHIVQQDGNAIQTKRTKSQIGATDDRTVHEVSSVDSEGKQARNIQQESVKINLGEKPTKGIQRDIKMEEDFSDATSIYSETLLELYHMDQEDLTPEEVQKYGFDPLAIPLLSKLMMAERTTLTFTVDRKTKTGTAMHGALTELFVIDEDEKEENVDHKGGKAVLAANRVKGFNLKITIQVNPELKYQLTKGELMQILIHELAVHGENFADLIEAYWTGNEQKIYTPLEEHKTYIDGENERYNQLSERAKERLVGDDNDMFKLRELADQNHLKGFIKDVEKKKRSKEKEGTPELAEREKDDSDIEDLTDENETDEDDSEEETESLATTLKFNIEGLGDVSNLLLRLGEIDE